MQPNGVNEIVTDCPRGLGRLMGVWVDDSAAVESWRIR